MSLKQFRVFLFFISFVVFAGDAIAVSEFKSLTIEWEPVVGSHGYEVQVQELSSIRGNRDLGKFKVKITEWTADLIPGKYQFRIRALDSRGVPGVWGEMIPFSVTAAAPELLTPANNLVIQAKEEKDETVEFTWKPVPGAVSYSLEIFPNDKSDPIRVESVDPNYKLPLPAGKKYTWRVTSIDEDKSPGDPVKSDFILIIRGSKLNKPEVTQPDSEFDTALKWSQPAHADFYDYVLERKNSKGGWDTVDKKNVFPKNEYEVPKKAKGGQYRFRIRANSESWLPSDVAIAEFPVYDGDRSAKGIESAKMRQSMERDKDNFFIASYLISYLKFNGENREAANRLSYGVLGGTGRLGYGFMPKGKWGFIGIVDYSGITINKKNYLFGSIEAQAVWRTYLSLSTQLRVFGGVFIKELPESSAFDQQEIVVSNIQQFGPLVGGQLWMSLTSKYGLQINLQTNLGIMKLKTPNARALAPSATYQIGILGSYKLKSHITGFAGVAYRVDSAKYLATPGDSSSPNNFAKDGDLNTVSLVGTYLNLYAEWGF